MTRGRCSPEQRAVCPLSKHFTDNDHIVAQRYKKPRNLPEQYRPIGRLIAQYIYTPENQQQLCRWEHDQKTGSESELLENCLPSVEFMQAAVARKAIEAA